MTPSTILFVYICLAGQSREECLRGYLDKFIAPECSSWADCMVKGQAEAARLIPNTGTYVMLITERRPVEDAK